MSLSTSCGACVSTVSCRPCANARRHVGRRRPAPQSVRTDVWSLARTARRRVCRFPTQALARAHMLPLVGVNPYCTGLQSLGIAKVTQVDRPLARAYSPPFPCQSSAITKKSGSLALRRCWNSCESASRTPICNGGLTSSWTDCESNGSSCADTSSTPTASTIPKRLTRLVPWCLQYWR
jgi:hypothetical protein